ncbi:hypothetical protein GGS24DRAFT_513476 [Hypoxylon argillaceum]|nr:hypothetical protein GGS24DRAFT_513476 [Hypoxylon argillaceum]
MAGIFKGSLLTIAACSSDSSTQGLFNSKTTSHLEDYLSHGLIRINNQFRDGRRSTLYFFGYPTGKGLRARYVYHGPLSTRAWCLQEHLLSPRTLYYTQSQIFWRCPHGDEYEDRIERHDGDSLAERYLFARDVGSEHIRREVWHGELVEMYSGLKLTKTSDKLVAISGLAEAINIRWQWKYVAGLWRESLAYGLCWKREGPGKKSSTYRCPSWSWASQDSAVRYNSVLEMELEASIINVEVDCRLKNAIEEKTKFHLESMMKY